MDKIWEIILLHQSMFQGMFIVKNLILRKKISTEIRGKNIEAWIAIAYFAFFISVSFFFSLQQDPMGKIVLFSDYHGQLLVGLLLLCLNLGISAAALIGLKDSWRVGIVANQKTDLVTSGIYRLTRNPYFVSYLLMFLAYTILLQNILLLGLSFLGFFFVDIMIKKEEKYLFSIHGDTYLQYKLSVPRYILL